MENSMQPQVQSEQDKMVPIDTSGEAVEVTLEDKKAKNKESEDTIEVKEEEPKVEVQEDKSKEEELNDYSQSVQRRIDKLTKKMREAERREQAAIDYAKKVQAENQNLQATTMTSSRERVTSDEAQIQSTEALLNTAYQQAIEQQDVTKQVEAQQKMAQLAIEKERLRLRKNKLDQQEAAKPVEQPSVEQIVNQPQQQQSQPDPRAQEWAQDNKWFGTDKAMTYTAMSLHDEILNEGFDASSDEYYTEIDRRIRKEFPHKFEDKDKSSRVVQTVASANRSTKSGRRTVRLTPSQVAIAKKLGVPLDEYAKHVKEA